MKRIKLVILIYCSILITSIGCEKVERKPDDIRFTEINKTITSSVVDSISGSCSYIVFMISKNIQNEYEATLLTNDAPNVCCDGFNEFLMDSDNENLQVLNLNDMITKSGNWGGSVLKLNNFAGKGERFIGYRSNTYPCGDFIYNYGWIKIELSAQGDVLTIVSRAYNLTDYNSIKAGQVE